MAIKYTLTINGSRMMQLADDMVLAGNREDWDRVCDYAKRIGKLAQECLTAAYEKKSEEA